MKIERILRKFGSLLFAIVVSGAAFASESAIDAVARSKVVDSIASKLEAEYVFPDIGKKWPACCVLTKKMAATIVLVTVGH